MVIDGWSSSMQAMGGMVNYSCWIEKILSKLVFNEQQGRTRMVNIKISNEIKIFRIEILINEVKIESKSYHNL